MFKKYKKNLITEEFMYTLSVLSLEEIVMLKMITTFYYFNLKSQNLPIYNMNSNILKVAILKAAQFATQNLRAAANTKTRSEITGIRRDAVNTILKKILQYPLNYIPVPPNKIWDLTKELQESKK